MNLVTFEPLEVDALRAALPAPGPADLPEKSLRGVSLEHARRRGTDYVRRVLDAAPLLGDRRFVVVEVRVALLRRGETQGQATWHLDTVGDPLHDSRPERHHLFVTGTASLTEFLAEPVTLDVPAGGGAYARMAALDAQLRALAPPTVRAPSLMFIDYGRLHLHRATPALHDERRLLVRVTETDVLRPYDRG